MSAITIAESFVNMLEENGFGKFGQDIFLYRVPNSLKTQTELFYIIPSGGSTAVKLVTGETEKIYQFAIYYRSQSARQVDATLGKLEEFLNCAHCVQLSGFQIMDISVTQYPTDQDLDTENRQIGLLQVQIKVYATCRDSES